MSPLLVQYLNRTFLLALLVLVGCVETVEMRKKVETKEHEMRSQQQVKLEEEAANSIGGCISFLQQNKGPFWQAMVDELSRGAGFLSPANAEGVKQSFGRITRGASGEDLTGLYVKEKQTADGLREQLSIMEEREKQADLVAQEELRQKQLKLDHQRRTEEKLQTFLYWAAGLFVIAGVVLAFVFEHKRLGAYLVGCAIACVAIAKTFSQIPDWAWPVLLIAGLLIGFGNSIYTYFVGLFQHPEKLGDYQVVKK